MRYETRSREAQALLARHGPGPVWVSVDPYLESPLPIWALAALLGGETAHGVRRFPRFLFGHELLQIRRAAEEEYIPLNLRAVVEFARANSYTQAVVSELIRQYRETLPHVFEEAVPRALEAHASPNPNDQGPARRRRHGAAGP